MKSEGRGEEGGTQRTRQLRPDEGADNSPCPPAHPKVISARTGSQVLAKCAVGALFDPAFEDDQQEQDEARRLWLRLETTVYARGRPTGDGHLHAQEAAEATSVVAASSCGGSLVCATGLGALLAHRRRDMGRAQGKRCSTQAMAYASGHHVSPSLGSQDGDKRR